MDQSIPKEGETSYPVERKFRSAAEKDQILNMPEVEREQILSERMQDIERDEQNRHLRALLGDHKEQSQVIVEDKTSIIKRKAEEEVEDDRRKSTRVRTTLGGRVEGESNPSLEKYRRVREKKAQEQQSKKKVEQNSPQARRRSRSSQSGNSLSSRSAGQISEKQSPVQIAYSSAVDPQPTTQASDQIQKKTSARDLKAEATLAEINRIRVGRDNFGQVCFTPGFEDKIKDCFGRIVLNPKTQEYRVIRIKGKALLLHRSEVYLTCHRFHGGAQQTVHLDLGPARKRVQMRTVCQCPWEPSAPSSYCFVPLFQQLHHSA